MTGSIRTSSASVFWSSCTINGWRLAQPRAAEQCAPPHALGAQLEEALGTTRPAARAGPKGASSAESIWSFWGVSANENSPSPVLACSLTSRGLESRSVTQGGGFRVDDGQRDPGKATDRKAARAHRTGHRRR